MLITKWEELIKSQDLNKSFTVEQIDSFSKFTLSELTWIKDIFWKQIKELLIEDFKYLKSDENFKVETLFDSDWQPDTIMYKNQLVYDHQISLALPGEWILECQKIAMRKREEIEKDKKLSDEKQRQRIIYELSANTF